MPYKGGSVTSFFGKGAQAVTKAAAHKMADDGGKSVERVVRANTPVRTGKLRASWSRKPAAGMEGGWVSEVSTDVEYAPYVEEGTGVYGPKHAPYVIAPKKPGGVLRFVAKDGTVVFARYVVHPGSPGNHMMAIALNVTEAAAAGGLFDGTLEEWTKEMEAQADKQV